MLLIQQSPMCSVRVGEESVGNKYALCSHLLGTDLRLLLLSQLTSEVILSLKGKAVDITFYNGYFKIFSSKCQTHLEKKLKKICINCK